MSSFNDAINKMNRYSTRPVTRLFMLVSADGKISTGCNDGRDFDSDLAEINGVKEGLPQYYEAEQNTDEWCLCSGKTKSKLGINNITRDFKHVDANIVILDNNHIMGSGVNNLLNQYNKVVVFTSNAEHPASHISCPRLRTYYIPNMDDLEEILHTLHENCDCMRITIQGGETINGKFIDAGLIDYVDFIVAPIIVGGKNTPNVVGGSDRKQIDDLSKCAVLSLKKCVALDNNYVHLQYKVTNSK